MSVEQLSLQLDAPGITFRSGDDLEGKVVLGLNTDQKIRGIVVELKGEAEVRWSETETRTDGDGESYNVSVPHSSRHTYLEKRVTLVGGAGQELLLPAGEHVYPFQARLPPGIPPSFEGVHGHVRYRARAVLQRPFASDHVHEVEVGVAAVVDLNLQPSLREPATSLREKTLCCLWCRSAPLTLLVRTPFTGFVPGQGVSVSVDVDNATGSRVERVVCRLLKRVLFHVRSSSASGSLRTEDKMAAVEFGSVEPRGSATWTRTLRIPQDLPPSGLPHCSSLIQLSYCLVVKAEVTGPHMDPAMEIPVVVGTVPLTQEVLRTEPSAPPLPFEAPPPSYVETVYGDGNKMPGCPNPPLTKHS